MRFIVSTEILAITLIRNSCCVHCRYYNCSIWILSCIIFAAIAVIRIFYFIEVGLLLIILLLLGGLLLSFIIIFQVLSVSLSIVIKVIVAIDYVVVVLGVKNGLNWIRHSLILRIKEIVYLLRHQPFLLFHMLLLWLLLTSFNNTIQFFLLQLNQSSFFFLLVLENDILKKWFIQQLRTKLFSLRGDFTLNWFRLTSIVLRSWLVFWLWIECFWELIKRIVITLRIHAILKVVE